MLTTTDRGEKLKDLRMRAGLSQEELAEKAGVGVATVIRFEHEQHEPNARTIRKLATALDVDPRKLF